MHPATVIRNACQNNGVLMRTPVFSDKRKDGTKRVKFWFANRLFEASQKKQRAIARELREAFGDQFVSAYFIANQRWGYTDSKSFCVRLKV